MEEPDACEDSSLSSAGQKAWKYPLEELWAVTERHFGPIPSSAAQIRKVMLCLSLGTYFGERGRDIQQCSGITFGETQETI